MSRENPKEKKNVISAVLIVIWVLLAVLIFIEAGSLFAEPTRARDLLEKAASQTALDTNDVQQYLEQSKTIANELKKKNLFAPPPPKQNPVKEVLGILGSEAFINGKWYKVGDMIADAKIVAIEPTHVKVEWDGQQTIFAPIGSSQAPGSGPPRPVPPPPGSGERRRAEMTVVGPPERLRGRGRFADMSPGDRDRLRQRFMNMSEEERREFRDHMRRRFEDEQ